MGDMMAKIRGAEQALNTTSRQPEQLWVWHALQRAGSYVSTVAGRRLVQGNKPLAMVGDKLLDTVLMIGALQHGHEKRICRSFQSLPSEAR
jgi:hypothetical protein